MNREVGESHKGDLPAVVETDKQRGYDEDKDFDHGAQATTRDVLQHWDVSSKLACQGSRLVIHLVKPTNFLHKKWIGGQYNGHAIDNQS